MLNKKVIHLITTIERGGAENQLLILAREQVSQGFNVQVIFLKGDGDLKKDFEKSGIYVNDTVASMNLLSQIRFLKKYFADNSSLVHTHLPRSEVIAFLTLKRNRYIISRHNYEKFWPSAPKPISILISRIVSCKAAGGIAISKSLKDYLIKNLEISKKFSMEVIYYGYNKKIELTSKETLREISNYNFKNSTFKIGIVSRLVPGKDYPTLLKAYKEVLLNNKNLILLIVGDGYLKVFLKDLAKDLGIEKEIEWLGKIDCVSEFLSELDLFVFTSKGEGFGLAILEAMLASKPILASNNSAIPEVLGINYPGLFECGNYLDLASKISRVINSPDYSKELIYSYKPQIKLFDSEEMAKLVMLTYENHGF